MIRLATPDDAAAVAAIYRPYVDASVISFEVVPPTADEMRARMMGILATFPWLVYEERGQVVGYAYASAHHVRAAYQWSVDVTVYIHHDFHRRGIGRELYAALFQRLVRQRFVNAYAGITLPNEKSVGLHEAIGFELVGIYRHVGFKFGQWYDVGWWALDLQPRPLSPREPLLPAAE
jgi:phosphinothricin acetyltransferase